MDNKTKRVLLFLFGCIPIRLLITYIAKVVGENYDYNDYLPILGYIALIPAFVWIYLFTFNKRKTGAEVFGDKIWWNNLRPIHSILYLLFAYNAINKNKNAYIYLLIDVIFGLISYIIYNLYN
jgi:hypothetical protein